MPSRYQPLADFLATQPPETVSVTLTLAEIERIVGVPLPAIASTQAWWTNYPTLRHARAWLAAGWRTQSPQTRRLPVRISFVRAPHLALV